MRLRAIAVATAAVLAVAGLAGCRTNVGQAAVIDGQQVTETQVSDYLTANAKPISVQQNDGSTTSIAPKPFVLDIVIERRLYGKLLAKTPSGAPTAAQLGTLQKSYLKGASAKTAVERLGAVGYSSSFDSLIVDVQVLATVLNSEQQQGVDVSTIARKLRFPVKVNPRYGTWDAKQLRLDYTGSAGVPAFVKLQPSATNAPAVP